MTVVSKFVHRGLSWAILPALIAALMLVAARPAAANDLVEFGHDVEVPASQEITGDCVVFGGDADIHGKVDGDAVVFGGDLHIYPEGRVDGDTISFGGEVINESTSAPHKAPHGMTPAPTPVPEATEAPAPSHEGGGPNAWAWYLIVLGVLTALTFVLFPRGTRTTLDVALERPLVAGLLGFCWPMILLIVVVALAVTVIGIPLMPVAVIAAFVGYLLGRAAIAVFLGRRLFEAAKVLEPSPLATLLLGLAIMTVVEGAVPFALGFFLEFCVSALALGAAMLALAKSRPRAMHPPGYIPPPMQPVFTPPAAPPPPSPPAVP